MCHFLLSYLLYHAGRISYNKMDIRNFGSMIFSVVTQIEDNTEYLFLFETIEKDICFLYN